MTYTVETRRVDALHPHPDNPRKHPEAQVKHLRDSLRRLGVYRNVVCLADGTLLAGHGVWEAAKVEGVKELPVLVFDGPEAEARRLLLADNALARLATDDLGRVLELLSEQRTELVGTGFDEAFLASLQAIAAAEESYRTSGSFDGDVGPQGRTGAPRIVIECDTEEQCRVVFAEFGDEWKAGKRSCTYVPS